MGHHVYLLIKTHKNHGKSKYKPNELAFKTCSESVLSFCLVFNLINGLSKPAKMTILCRLLMRQIRCALAFDRLTTPISHPKHGATNNQFPVMAAAEEVRHQPPPSVQVAKETMAWLESSCAAAGGYLVGCPSSGAPMDVLGALARLPEESMGAAGWAEDRRVVEEYLPAGLQVLGLFYYGTAAEARAALQEAMTGGRQPLQQTSGSFLLAVRELPSRGDVHSESGGAGADGSSSSSSSFRFYSCPPGQVGYTCKSTNASLPVWLKPFQSVVPGQMPAWRALG